MSLSKLIEPSTSCAIETEEVRALRVSSPPPPELNSVQAVITEVQYNVTYWAELWCDHTGLVAQLNNPAPSPSQLAVLQRDHRFHYNEAAGAYATGWAYKALLYIKIDDSHRRVTLGFEKTIIRAIEISVVAERPYLRLTSSLLRSYPWKTVLPKHFFQFTGKTMLAIGLSFELRQLDMPFYYFNGEAVERGQDHLVTSRILRSLRYDYQDNLHDLKRRLERARLEIYDRGLPDWDIIDSYMDGMKLHSSLAQLVIDKYSLKLTYNGPKPTGRHRHHSGIWI